MDTSPELPGFPDTVVEAGQKFFEALRPIFSPGALSVGGDPILAARWGHQPVQAIKIYVHPETLARAHTRHGYGRAVIEALAPIASAPVTDKICRPDTDQYLGQFAAEIDHVPIWILATPAKGWNGAGGEYLGRTPERFPGTNVKVWDTLDILAWKLRRTQERMEFFHQVPLQADLDALAAAYVHDESSLNLAFHTFGVRERAMLCEELRRCDAEVVSLGQVANLLDGRPKRRPEEADDRTIV